MFTRICIRCACAYTLDGTEIRDGTYSQLCDECLRAHVEADDEPPIPERVIGELN